MAIELVSYADLKSLLGLEGTIIGDYPALMVLKLSVTSAIEEYLGRELEVKARTEDVFVNESPTKMIALVGLPISSVSSVVITQNNTTETLSENDYDIAQYGIKLHSNVSHAKISITYTGGVSTVPVGIERAALLQTAYEFQAKDQIGAENVSTDGGMVSRPALGLLKETKRMLKSEIHPLRWK